MFCSKYFESIIGGLEQVLNCLIHAFSSTGEFASMTIEERESAAEIARASWPGRQFVNVSSCNVEDSLRLLHHSQQVKDHLKARFWSLFWACL